MQTPAIQPQAPRPRIVASSPIPNLPHHLQVSIKHAGRRYEAVIKETEESIMQAIIKGKQ